LETKVAICQRPPVLLDKAASLAQAVISVTEAASEGAFYAAVIPSLKFKPALHGHYQETVLPMKDGLPKQRDIPKEMGGSGELLPE